MYKYGIWFKYLGTTLMNQNSIQEEIKIKIKKKLRLKLD